MEENTPSSQDKNLSRHEHDNLSAITCGIIDHRYGQALYGTHHAIKNGKTLCGLFPRDTHSTVWFGESPIFDDRQADGITCKRCRKSMGLVIGRSDSKVML